MKEKGDLLLACFLACCLLYHVILHPCSVLLVLILMVCLCSPVCSSLGRNMRSYDPDRPGVFVFALKSLNSGRMPDGGSMLLYIDSLGQRVTYLHNEHVLVSKPLKGAQVQDVVRVCLPSACCVLCLSLSGLARSATDSLAAGVP